MKDNSSNRNMKYFFSLSRNAGTSSRNVNNFGSSSRNLKYFGSSSRNMNDFWNLSRI